MDEETKMAIQSINRQLGHAQGNRERIGLRLKSIEARLQYLEDSLNPKGKGDK